MLSSRALRLIVDAAREHDLPAGTLLVREGDRDRDLYVVMRGEARVMRGGAVITTLGVGDFFGEFALLADEPRSATVIAGTDVRVMVRRGRLDDLAAVAEPLAGDQTRLRAFLADHQ